MVIESVSKLLHIGQHPLTLQIYVCPLPPSSLCQPTHELSRNVCPTKKGMRSHKHTSACHCLHTKISPSHYNTAPWFIPRQPSLFLQQNLLCVSAGRSTHQSTAHLENHHLPRVDTVVPNINAPLYLLHLSAGRMWCHEMFIPGCFCSVRLFSLRDCSHGW